MQRRTNEWYQGLREASSEEGDEDIVLELETTLSSPHKKSPNPLARWSGSSSSNKSPPLQRGGRGLLKVSPTPQLWAEVDLVGGGRSSRSSGSNSELGFVRDRTASRSPPSAGDGGGGGLLPSSSS